MGMRAGMAATVTGLAAGLAAAMADTLLWVGPDGGRWDEPSHWSPPQYPFMDDVVVFDLAGETSIDFKYPYLEVRRALFRAGTVRLLGDGVHDTLIALEEEPVNPPPLVVADLPGVAASVESQVVVATSFGAIGLAGDGSWATTTLMAVLDLFIGVQRQAAGEVRLDGPQAELKDFFDLPLERVTVGFEGKGALTLSGGATGFVQELRAAVEAGSSAELTIQGAGTMLTLNDLRLGNGDTTITIRDGATLDWPDDYRLRTYQEIPGVQSTGSLTLSGGQYEPVRWVDLEREFSLTLQDGAVLPIENYLACGPLTLEDDGTMLHATSAWRVHGLRVRDGATLLIQPVESRAAFGGPVELSGAAVRIDDGVEVGESVSGLISVNAGVTLGRGALEMRDGAVLAAEGEVLLGVPAPSIIEGEGTRFVQTVQWADLIGATELNRYGALSIAAWTTEDQLLTIIDGGELRGAVVHTSADIRVGAGGAMIADDLLAIRGHEIEIGSGGALMTPMVMIGAEPLGSAEPPRLVISGEIATDLLNGGTLEIADDALIGALRVEGEYNQNYRSVTLPPNSTGNYLGTGTLWTRDGVLHIDIAAPATHDTLEVTNAATLGGTLRANFLGGFEPSWGDRFTVLTAGSIEGEFETIEAPPVAPELRWEVEYTETSATLTLHRRTDLSRDYRVNGADLAILLSHWGARLGPEQLDDIHGPAAADLSGDRFINAADLGILLGDWGLQAD